jgi:hypothetical protein
MRLVTAVTTLIQLKRPNYFRRKTRSQKSNFCPRGNIVSPTSGAVSRVVLAVDQRFLVYPR